jgi:chromate transporter
MHREVVDRRAWLSDRRFLHAVNYCMLLPGPEAQQLATYIGWLMNGVGGGLVAGSLFVLPGFVVMLALSVVYAEFGDVRWVSGLLFGLQAAVVAIVAQAVLRLSRRTLRTWPLRALAVCAFAALFLFAVPFPVVIIAAGLLGWLVSGAGPEDPDPLDPPDPPVPRADARRALLAAGVALVAWLAPVAALVGVLGPDHVLSQQAVLFSKTAVITFGGAYAVLAYVSQQAVQAYDWITAEDMATGLGLAETTPGPLILVVQFVGFLAAYNDPGSLTPLAAGLCGALVTVWVTFVPCFMVIFAGAPYVDRLRHSGAWRGALTGIGAAVVGVIANLAVWFALTTFIAVDERDIGPLRLYVPDLATIDLWAVGLAGVAAALVLWGWATLRVLAVCAGLGGLVALVG